ncbi:MAG: hypothetical protein QOD24_3408 [Solirubrobacteraceae bacterium]|jgi:hypothetical protein|nr:hypothetical protein [Solirubrobacteraceae bacterium]
MDERITVTVSGDPDAAAEQLRAAGMNVEQVLSEVGIITGSVAAGQQASLADLPDVVSVEAEHSVQLPPPDADIQ